MPETDEEKRKRWAKAASVNSFMTPSMVHALNMSKQQSRNKYKEQYDKTKSKFTPVASTPEIENVKRQSTLLSQSKYKSEFEKNKAKFTQVADDPETLRLSKMSNQASNITYTGKGSAVAKTRKRNTASSRTSSIKASSPTEEKQSNETSPPLEKEDELPSSESVAVDPPPDEPIEELEHSLQENLKLENSETEELQAEDPTTQDLQEDAPYDAGTNDLNQNHDEAAIEDVYDEVAKEEDNPMSAENGDCDVGDDTNQFADEYQETVNVNGPEEIAPDLQIAPELNDEIYAVPIEDDSPEDTKTTTGEYQTEEAIYEDPIQNSTQEAEEGGNLDDFYASLE
uniref:Uncharacterized protein n=1 Tax=Ciona savignyi TaxID=51511 RepID=H2YLT3_CIOSA